MKPLLVVNPRAAGSRTGKGFSGVEAAAITALGALDVRFTERRGHAADIACEAARAGRDLIVAVGGDGTLSEVIDGVLRSGAESRVGFIAQGTGGDFRRSLGIGSQPIDCLRAVASGRERRIDAGRLTYRGPDDTVQQRHFVNIVSAGLGGLVDRYIEQTPRWIGGRLGYYAAALRAILRCPETRLKARLATDGTVLERYLHARVVAVCNGQFFGSGMHMAPMARVDDGVLEIVSVTQPTRLHMLLRSRTIYDGSHLRLAGVEHLRCTSISLDIDDETARRLFLLDVDGEPLGYLPLTAEVLPGALTLRA